MLEKYNDVLTVHDVQAILCIGKTKAYELLGKNIIKHIRVGKKILIPKQNVVDFLLAAH